MTEVYSLVVLGSRLEVCDQAVGRAMFAPRAEKNFSSVWHVKEDHFWMVQYSLYLKLPLGVALFGAVKSSMTLWRWA